MTSTAIHTVTLGVRDPEGALRLFRDTCGLRVDHEHEAGPDLARAWRLPEGTRVHLWELSYGGYGMGKLRLARFEPTSGVKVRSDEAGSLDTATDVGPKAIDFYVRPPMALAVEEWTKAGYPPRSEPIRWEIGQAESEELLFTGPESVPILLMYGHRHPAGWGRDWPGRYSEVSTVSIVTDDLAASGRLYGEVLGLSREMDAEVGADHRDQAAKLTGVGAGTRMTMQVYMDPAEPSGKILLVHYHGASTSRLAGRMRPGNLGWCLTTHEVADLDDTVARATAAGFPLFSPATTVELGPLGARRVALVQGPNEELLELREGAR